MHRWASFLPNSEVPEKPRSWESFKPRLEDLEVIKAKKWIYILGVSSLQAHC